MVSNHTLLASQVDGDTLVLMKRVSSVAIFMIYGTFSFF